LVDNCGQGTDGTLPVKILLLGQDAEPGDLYVPIANVLHIPNPGTTLDDIDDLPYMLGGQAAKPSRALAFKGTGGNTTLIAGLGVTEAAELQDMAYALYERQQQNTRGDWRERFGFPSRETVVDRIRSAMAEKAKHFKQHAVTNNGQAPREKRVY
jgi:hypothetical protein